MNNSVVTNNNYRRLQDLILLFKILMGIKMFLRNLWIIWAWALKKVRHHCSRVTVCSSDVSLVKAVAVAVFTSFSTC